MIYFAETNWNDKKFLKKKLLRKEKVEPGQIIAIDFKKGKLFKDKAIKNLLAKNYKKYNKQIIDLEKKISNEDEKPNFVSEDLRERQYLSGLV